MSGDRSVAKFWAIAAHMRRRSSAWMPTAGYELRRRVSFDGKRWTLSFKVHVFSDLDDDLERWSGIRLMSTITIWPPTSVRGGARRLDAAWCREVDAVIGRLGYSGGWQSAPGVGRWANFEKNLTRISDLKAEVRRFEMLARSPRSILVPVANEVAAVRTRAGAQRRARRARRAGRLAFEG
jgi:hypothetical protein